MGRSIYSRMAVTAALSLLLVTPTAAMAQGPTQAAEAGMMMLFGLLLKTPAARAQAVGTVPGGAYEQLSGSNQKIARAIFEAQKPEAQGGKRLTLDQIAAQKKAQASWSDVFQTMRSEGRVQVASLGQALSLYENPRR